MTEIEDWIEKVNNTIYSFDKNNLREYVNNLMKDSPFKNYDLALNIIYSKIRNEFEWVLLTILCRKGFEINKENRVKS